MNTLKKEIQRIVTRAGAVSLKHIFRRKLHVRFLHWKANAALCSLLTPAKCLTNSKRTVQTTAQSKIPAPRSARSGYCSPPTVTSPRHFFEARSPQRRNSLYVQLRQNLAVKAREADAQLKENTPRQKGVAVVSSVLGWPQFSRVLSPLNPSN